MEKLIPGTTSHSVSAEVNADGINWLVSEQSFDLTSSMEHLVKEKAETPVIEKGFI